LCLGAVQVFSNRAAQGIALCERALALDRNLAGAHGLVGLAKYLIGRAEETEAAVQEALRLSPRDTNVYAWLFFLGAAHLSLDRNDDAAVWLSRSIEANRNYPLTHFFLATALANLGRPDEARSALQAGLALQPDFTVSRYRMGAYSDNPTFLVRRERVMDAMRKAGIPEG
jgi:tetratricopeptide (TPR) repeat protein